MHTLSLSISLSLYIYIYIYIEVLRRRGSDHPALRRPDAGPARGLYVILYYIIVYCIVSYYITL